MVNESEWQIRDDFQGKVGELPSCVNSALAGRNGFGRTAEHPEVFRKVRLSPTYAAGIGQFVGERLRLLQILRDALTLAQRLQCVANVKTQINRLLQGLACFLRG